MKLTLPNVPGYSRICHAIEIDLIEALKHLVANQNSWRMQLRTATASIDDEAPRSPRSAFALKIIVKT